MSVAEKALNDEEPDVRSAGAGSAGGYEVDEEHLEASDPVNAGVLCMSDEKDMVKYTAAATVLRLTAIKTARARSKERGKVKEVGEAGREGRVIRMIGRYTSTVFTVREIVR